MEWHPFSRLFPMMSDAEIQEMADDIRAVGLKQDIHVDTQGRILDGRNRAAACALAGVEPRCTVFSGTEAEALKLVVSLNLKRRHLTESQRGMVAADVANLKLGTNRFSEKVDGPIGPSTPLQGVTIAEACELLNVGNRTVKRARKVHKDGIEELKAAVMSGEMSVFKASEIAALPKEQQKAAMEEPRSKPRARTPKADISGDDAAAGKRKGFSKPRLGARATELKSAIDELIEITKGSMATTSMLVLRNSARRIEAAAKYFLGDE